MFEDDVESPAGLRGVSLVPFSLYLLAWVVLAVASFVVLKDDAAAGSFLWSLDYGRVAAAGLVLAALGPALSVAVWVVARASRPPERRAGLLADALLKGGGAALVGTVLWLVSLFALDVCCRGA
ncbi:MAG: hypothetical protein QMD76_01795 [Anaerosomatales bacterium]|nr:hypothetical protein [Anaerosomatales bacterium]